MSTPVPLVLVTGASGFVASHIVRQLLANGRHRVRGTVRDLDRVDKVRPLRELCPDAEYPLELVRADLTESEGWLDAVRDCTYVIHTASPFPVDLNPEDENELIKPAVEGTLFILRACQEVGGVKRVVMTSSVVAVCGGFDTRKPGVAYTEADWTATGPDSTTSAYTKSKTLAERAAWDFVDEMPVAERFELATMNPAYVLGPVLCGGYATSMELTKRLLEGGIPGIPHINFTVVDVRDVAGAHIVAMTSPEAAGRRHVLAPHTVWMSDVAGYYREEFGALGYRLPWFRVPYALMWLVSWFDKTVRLMLPSWGRVTEFDSSRMTSVLGVTPTPVRDTFVDMAHSMIRKGFVKMTPEYKKSMSEYQ